MTPTEEEQKNRYEMKVLERGLPDGWPESFKPLTDDQIQELNDDVTHLLQRAKRRRRQRITRDTKVILETLRKMAWSRAKAELESILETYWSMDTEFEEVETEIGEFIERMEDRL